MTTPISYLNFCAYNELDESCEGSRSEYWDYLEFVDALNKEGEA